MSRSAGDVAMRPESAPRISVVMPVYNAERLLDECLRALASSTGGVEYEIAIKLRPDRAIEDLSYKRVR